jgi:hypothetical protein
MSLIEDLGGRVAAASVQLPVGEVLAALERLRAGSALLMWVRQESSRPMGVPELAGATEHLEQAGRALQAAQDTLTDYLAAIGLGFDATPPPQTGWRSALDRPEPVRPPEPVPAGTAPLGRWWAERVGVLTDGPVDRDPAEGTDRATGSAGGTASDAELLRRVARHTRAGDRGALRRELAAAAPPVGLALAAIAPPVLHRLAGQLLGHQPRAQDLPELTRATREPVRALLPRLPPEVLDSLLARVCRVPPQGEPPPVHPADPAVTGGVLVGVLLQRLGRDVDALDPRAPEPLPGTDHPARNRGDG